MLLSFLRPPQSRLAPRSMAETGGDDGITGGDDGSIAGKISGGNSIAGDAAVIGAGISGDSGSAAIVGKNAGGPIADKIAAAAAKITAAADKFAGSAEKIASSAVKFAGYGDKIAFAADKIDAYKNACGATADKIAAYSDKIAAYSDKIAAIAAAADKAAAAADKIGCEIAGGVAIAGENDGGGDRIINNIAGGDGNNIDEAMKPIHDGLADYSGPPPAEVVIAEADPSEDNSAEDKGGREMGAGSYLYKS